ncbi:TrbI/VirB10 family protein [Novosphingobium sp. BW1]|uniref:TrbI/VirB10 family protein n=1 Tax=Novosphingobium sp. BW1 TaxID=2592621 RepID=UPI00352F6C83
MPGSEPAVASGKEGFARQLETRSSRNAQVLEPAASSRVLMAGSVIAASLVIGINSDLPGMVIAQVTRNVFDSITGRVLLIPQGSRLIGNYDSQVSYGQSRVLLVWQRLVLPDGRSLRLDNMPASDPQGFAGLEDKLNAHTGRLLKGAAIATLLSVGTELSLSGDSDLVDAIRQGTQGSVSRAGDSITRRNLDVAPTIEVRPGAPVRLLVRQDLVLGPWIKENAQ